MTQTPDSPWIRGIDGAAILGGRYDHSLEDCIELHALMQGWRDGLRALQGGIEKHAGADRSCLAREIADYIDDLIHDTSLEEVLEALKDQIELAEDIENGCVADPVEEWRKDYYASLGVDTSRVSSRRMR